MMAQLVTDGASMKDERCNEVTQGLSVDVNYGPPRDWLEHTHLKALREVHGEGRRHSVRWLDEGPGGLQQAVAAVVIQEMEAPLRHHHHPTFHRLPPPLTSITAATAPIPSVTAVVGAAFSHNFIVFIVSTSKLLLYFLFPGGHVFISTIRVLADQPTNSLLTMKVATFTKHQ